MAEAPKGLANLKAVAEDAGVSLATASRVLNGSNRNVGVELRERVLASAARLNYSPNLAAQAVAKGATSSIALIVSDITDPYFSAIASGLMSAADERDLVVSIGVTAGRSEREAALVRLLRGQRPRGLVLVGSRRSESSDEELVAELSAFEMAGGCVALVTQEGLPFPTVSMANVEGAAALARRMIDLGYTSPAVLAGPPGVATGMERVSGFLGVYAEAGMPVPPERVVPGAFSRDGGFLAAERLRRRGLTDIDLIFATTDVMAVGAISYLRDIGLRLPEQMAIAGFDDVEQLRDITPALTTVALPLREIGVKALDLAMGMMGVETHVRVEGTVVVRDSTPPRRRR